MAIKIRRKLVGEADSAYTLIATLPDTATSYTDTGGEPETPYYYQFLREGTGGTWEPVAISATTQAPVSGLPAFTTMKVLITGNSIMNDLQTANMASVMGASLAAGGKTLENVQNWGIYGMRWDEMLYGAPGHPIPEGKGDYAQLFVRDPYNASTADLKVMVCMDWVNQGGTPAENVAWAKQYTAFAKSVGWHVFLPTPLDNLRSGWRPYKAELVTLIKAEPGLADYIIDLSNIKYLGMDGAANDAAGYPDGTHIVTGGPGGTPTYAQRCFTDVIRKSVATAAGLPIPNALTNIAVTMSGSTATVNATFTTGSFMEYGISSNANPPTNWQASNVFTNVAAGSTAYARMFIKTSNVLSVAVSGGGTANTTPGANTFADFNDTTNTVRLVPFAGVPITDYRYYFLDATDALLVPSDGIIDVGDIAGPVNTYAIAVSGRNESPVATSAAFTTSSGGSEPLDADTQVQIDKVSTENGAGEDVPFLDALVKHAKANGYWSLLLSAGGLRTGHRTTVDESVYIGLKTPSIGSPNPNRKPGLTSSNGRPVYAFRGQPGDTGDMLFNTVGSASLTDGVKSMTMITVGAITPRAAYQSALNFGDAGDFMMGASDNGFFYAQRQGASSQGLVHPTPNTGQTVRLIAAFGATDNVLDLAVNGSWATSNTVNTPKSLTDKGLAIGTAITMWPSLMNHEFEIVLHDKPSRSVLNAIDSFLATWFPAGQ